MERKGIEPSTSRMPFCGSSNASETSKGLTETVPDACTTACTNSPKITNATDLDALAAELLALPKEERARLLAKLLGKGEGEKLGEPAKRSRCGCGAIFRRKGRLPLDRLGKRRKRSRGGCGAFRRRRANAAFPI